MWTRLIPPLILLVTCCTAHTAPESEPAPEASADPSGPAYTSPHNVWPRNPCTIGTVIQTFGWKVAIPLPCDPLWMDKGDPPPETTVTVPMPDELDPGIRRAQPGMPASALRALRMQR
jgi:hypothetical protein